MRLLFLLLFCTHLFVSVSASSPRSDLWSRGASMSRYIVTPVDPANTTATENMLKSMFGEANIVTSKHHHETTFWAIASSSEDIIASSIEALEGVQQVERQDLAARAQTVSTDVERYTVQPKENADDAKMDDFLKSKIQLGTLMVTVKQPDGKVMVWFNAALSQEAKEEVEKYDGTEKLIPLLSVASSSASTASASPQSEEKRSDVAAQDTQHYGASAADDTNITETEEFLRSKVKNPEDILQHSRKDVVYGWYNLELDAETKEEVEAYRGIKAMRLSKMLAEFRAAPTSYWSQRHKTLANQERKALLRRANEWVLQEGADKALVIDSQYSGAILDSLPGFFHLSEAGKDVFIYYMDRGVQLDAKNKDLSHEFRPPGDIPRNIQVLQAPGSTKAMQDPLVDESGHGTAVASKALGTKYGVAKKAILVSVKVSGENEDIPEAFELIRKDIEANPGRGRRSVVFTALGSPESWTYETAMNDYYAKEDWLDGIKDLQNLGVPFLCAAGNFGQVPNRLTIDTLPAVLQDNNTPIIVVGAADYEGARELSSQIGSQLTVYAPGKEIVYQNRDRGGEGKGTGTSLAVPQVAGLIATYLSYDSKPWDESKQGAERIKAIRDYIASDRSSWERKSGIRMIWNGAGEDEHRSAGANGAGTKPPNPFTPPTPPSPPPAQPSKALAVILQRELISPAASSGFSPIYKNRWLFYETDRGVPIGCKDEKDALANAKVGGDAKMILNAPWPSITQPLQIDNMECEYKNNGETPGALWCKGRKDAITCYEEHAKKDKDPKYCRNGDGEITRRPMAYCEW